MMLPALLATLLSVIPVHGVVLDTQPDGSVIVRTDAVPAMLPAEIRRYRLEPAVRLRTDAGVDAYLDRSTHPWTLREAMAAAPFAPGLPDPGRVIPVDLGGTLPAARLVDQDGHFVQLAQAFRDKTLLLSFIFTRCPDRTLCPAISGKFAYLQAHLDPRRFALAEITLDPQYDSPAVLRNYGAAYGAKPGAWTLLTGTGSVLQHLLNEFGISSLRVSSSNFLHNDKLYLVTPKSRVAYIVETGGWDPQAVLAQARAVAGLASNPFERFKLALVAGVIALCGGSQFAGIALLELTLFSFFTLVALAGLLAVARVIWGGPSVKG
jgi:protein SCO1